MKTTFAMTPHATSQLGEGENPFSSTYAEIIQRASCRSPAAIWITCCNTVHQSTTARTPPTAGWMISVQSLRFPNTMEWWQSQSCQDVQSLVRLHLLTNMVWLIGAILQSIVFSGTTIDGEPNLQINMQGTEEPATATHPVNWRIIAGLPVSSGDNSGVMSVKWCSCEEGRPPPVILDV